MSSPDLASRRRALLIVYKRYLQAERAWYLAQAEALSWFPRPPGRTVTQIGNPGSRLRRLHDRRDRAMEQLALAQQRFDDAKRRATRRIQILALPAR
jgi:hypothetical protein